MFDQAAPLVLIVEDDVFQRLELVQVLKNARFDAAGAASGEEAVGHLRKGHRIDLVVTDITLGRPKNGWDVAESFRSVHPEIPVVYVSDNSAKPERQVPNSAFLYKPWQLADVIKALPVV